MMPSMRATILSSPPAGNWPAACANCAGSLSIIDDRPPILRIWLIWSLKSLRSKPLPDFSFLAKATAFSRRFPSARIFDQRQHVAHAEDARSHPLRMEGFETGQFFADAGELDRLAGDVTHRQRRTAARIAIELGEDDAGQRQRSLKALAVLMAS
jgi:hypothetical protein